LIRLFFATDVHGSEVCWKKFLAAAKFYDAQVLILGGDMTGKALVPISRLPDGRWKATLLQQQFLLNDEPEVAEMERRVASRGYYPFRTGPEELAEFQRNPERVELFFQEKMLSTIERWMALADERLDGSAVRCFVCPGNDDHFATDDVIRRARRVELAEGRGVELGDGLTMYSTGWSNPTPWQTHRELPEEELAGKIEAMIPPGADTARAVFNFHCPPHGTNLDETAEVDENLDIKDAGRSLVHVGSTAVRQAILKHQPALSLHGHIHEGKGTSRLGKTLAINPGSLYEQGVLQGAVVDLDARKGVRSYSLTTG
jgi:Icc-related predicted phosphoesterase